MEVDVCISNAPSPGDQAATRLDRVSPSDSITEICVGAASTPKPVLELPTDRLEAAASHPIAVPMQDFNSGEGDERHAFVKFNDGSLGTDIPPPRHPSFNLAHRNPLSSSVMRKLSTAVLAPSSKDKEYKRANLVNSDRKISHDTTASHAPSDDDIEAQAEAKEAKRPVTEFDARKRANEGEKNGSSDWIGRAAGVVASSYASAIAKPGETSVFCSSGGSTASKDPVALMCETQDIFQMAYRGSIRPEELEFNEEPDGSLTFDLGGHPKREQLVQTFVTGLVEKRSDMWAVTQFDSNGLPTATQSSPSSVLSGPGSSATGLGAVNDPNSHRALAGGSNREDLPAPTVHLDLRKLKTFVAVRRRETDASQPTFYSIRTRTCSIAHAIFVGEFAQVLALASKQIVPLFRPSHFQAGVRALKDGRKTVKIEDWGAEPIDNATVWLCLYLKNAKEPAHLRPNLDDRDIPVRLFRLPYTHYYAVSFEYAVLAADTKLQNVGGREVCVQLDVLTGGSHLSLTHQSSTAGCEVKVDVQLSGMKKQSEARAAALADAMEEEPTSEDASLSPSKRGKKGSKSYANIKNSKKKKVDSETRKEEARAHGKRFANKGTQSLPPAARAQLLCGLNAAPLPVVASNPGSLSSSSADLSGSPRRTIVFKSSASSSQSQSDTTVSVAFQGASAKLSASKPGLLQSLSRSSSSISTSQNSSNARVASISAHYGLNKSADAVPSPRMNLSDSPKVVAPSHPAVTTPSAPSHTTMRSPHHLGEPKRRLQKSHLRPLEQELQTRDSGMRIDGIAAATPAEDEATAFVQCLSSLSRRSTNSLTSTSTPSAHSSLSTSNGTLSASNPPHIALNGAEKSPRNTSLSGSFPTAQQGPPVMAETMSVHQAIPQLHQFNYHTTPFMSPATATDQLTSHYAQSMGAHAFGMPNLMSMGMSPQLNAAHLPYMNIPAANMNMAMGLSMAMGRPDLAAAAANSLLQRGVMPPQVPSLSYPMVLPGAYGQMTAWDSLLLAPERQAALMASQYAAYGFSFPPGN